LLKIYLSAAIEGKTVFRADLDTLPGSHPTGPPRLCANLIIAAEGRFVKRIVPVSQIALGAGNNRFQTGAPIAENSDAEAPDSMIRFDRRLRSFDLYGRPL
jgi:hypothetical protein